MERIPSFYMTKTYQSKKRGRDFSSPTGKTPLQESKKPLCENVLGTQKKIWTEKEKKFLFDFTMNGVPTEKPYSFWQECARQMNSCLGSVRTGEMCRSRYKRAKDLFPLQDENVETIKHVEAETQTLPILPICKSKRSTCYWASLNPPVKESCDKDAAPVIQDMWRLLKSRFTVEEISPSERAVLLHTLLDPGCDVVSIANHICSISSLKLAVENKLLMDIENSASSKCIRSKSSYLYGKDYNSLEQFSFDDLFKEMSDTKPFFSWALLAVSVPTKKLGTCQMPFLQALIPKLSLTYSTLLQTRFSELSRLQKTISVALLEEHVHEKVFDRLQIMGVTTSYKGATRLMEDIGHHSYSEVTKAVQKNKKFRLVGDNCIVKVGVKHERSERHGTMFNWFASAIIMQTSSFSDLPDTPQCMSQNLPLSAFLPTQADEARIKKDYRFLIGKIAQDFCPHLSFLYNDLPQHILGPHSKMLKEENLVVPLEVLPLNEQKYTDVVQILDHYENTIEEIYQQSCKPIETVHIGGDQLTRERFSGGKGLRNSELSDKERLHHLYPISFELWHTVMNFLSLIFNKLFNENCFEKGTLNAAKILLSRKTVNKDVKNHYGHDKDFFLSFLRSYVVEALCHFFGLQDLTDKPTKNIPPDNVNEKWVQETMDKFVDEYVWARNSNATNIVVTETKELVTTPLQLILPDGTISFLCIQKQETKSQQQAEYDRVKHYSHCVLDLGLLYLQLLDIIQCPDRDRLLSTFKYAMHVFKAANSRSKYALEIHRFLCHQQSSYSLQTAHQACYGLFVNTGGKVDSHIPADLQMEHLIRKIKKLFKATGPSNIEGSVVKKSRALAGIARISENFGQSGHVTVRSTKHKKKTAHDDELKLIKQLKYVQPFTANYNRQYESFADIAAPSTTSLSQEAYIAWINYHKANLAFEYGK